MDLNLRKKYGINVIAPRQSDRLQINIDSTMKMDESMKLIIIANVPKISKLVRHKYKYHKKGCNRMTKILLVEDDKAIVSNLTEFLTKEGFTVKSTSGQFGALALLNGERFDLVLLDISLSNGSGYTVCKAVKADYHIPVIFLTASGDEYSTVTGFDLGADDYIPKPFRPRELVSRIKNILRLTGNVGSVIKLGDVELDTVNGTATKSGKDLYLSALEYRLLLVFINNRGIVLSRNKLLESIWDIAGEFVNDNTLTVYIKRLREKIEEDPQNPTIIKTVRGLGYKVD